MSRRLRGPWPYFLLAGSLCTTTKSTSACSAPSEESAVVDGVYQLATFRDAQVPARVEEILSGGQGTGCWIIATDGRLTVAAVDHVFSFSATFRDSCDNRLLWESIVRGRLDQSGAALSLITPGVGNVTTFPGRLRGDTVVIEMGDNPSNRYTYAFVKPR